MATISRVNAKTFGPLTLPQSFLLLPASDKMKQSVDIQDNKRHKGAIDKLMEITRCNYGALS